MNPFVYRNTRIIYLFAPALFFICLVTILVMKELMNSIGKEMFYAISMLFLMLLYTLKILVHVIIKSPYAIKKEGNILVIKFVFFQKKYAFADIKSIKTISLFNDSLYRVKVIIGDDYSSFIIPWLDDSSQKFISLINNNNEMHDLDHGLFNESNELNSKKIITFSYPWEYNFQFRILLVIFLFFITISFLMVMLVTSQLIWLILFSPFFYVLLLNIKIFLFFFINKPHEIKLIDEFIEIRIGFKNVERIQMKSIERIFYRGGLFQLFCISYNGRMIYFDSDLRHYRNLINCIKHHNSRTEIDYLSIKKAEEKERRRK